MIAKTKRSIKYGLIALSLKIFILLLVLLAMFATGLTSVKQLWLGVEVRPLNNTLRTQFHISQNQGVLVNQVLEHSPADHGGLKRGDVILSVSGQPVLGANDIQRIIDTGQNNQTVEITIVRHGITYVTKTVLDYRSLQANALTHPSLYDYTLTFWSASGLFLMGLAAGTLGSMVGCGGGVLKVSALIVCFGFEIFLAKVVSLITSGFMSISGSLQYLKFKRVDKEALKYLLPSALAGCLIGTALSILLNQHIMELILGLFLIYTAMDIFYDLYRTSKLPKPKTAVDDSVYVPDPNLDRSVLVIAGLPMGISSALLGITGSVVGNPLQSYLVKFPIKTCIANIVVCAIFVSFLGGFLLLAEGLAKNYFSLDTFLKVSLCVIPGSLLGGQIGPCLTHRLPSSYVKMTDAIVVLIIACKMMF